jgi:hypothetical protein
MAGAAMAKKCGKRNRTEAEGSAPAPFFAAAAGMMVASAEAKQSLERQGDYRSLR